MSLLTTTAETFVRSMNSLGYSTATRAASNSKAVPANSSLEESTSLAPKTPERSGKDVSKKISNNSAAASTKSDTSNQPTLMSSFGITKTPNHSPVIEITVPSEDERPSSKIVIDNSWDKTDLTKEEIIECQYANYVADSYECQSIDQCIQAWNSHEVPLPIQRIAVKRFPWIRNLPFLLTLS